MWILYAALGAVAKAITSFLRKKISTTNSAIYVFLSSSIVAVIIAVITLFLAQESLASMKHAPALLILSAVVQIVAIRANLYAFRHEELSYITPMFALTPLYAAIVAYLTIGEAPSSLGLLGIFTIIAGVYVVTGSKNVSIMTTIRHVGNNKGARAGMLVPLAYAVSATFNKEAINEGVTPLASVVAITGIMAFSHIYVLHTVRSEVSRTLKNVKLLKLILLASIFGVASVGFASLALSGAFTSYALSIRRLDVLITIFIGWKFMGDKNFIRRITGTLVMLVGVILISFG